MVAAANIVLSLVLTAPVASAEDGSQAPEFLLGDVGVRVDLPAGWKMTRWSDWDLQAEKPDEKLILFAWQTPLQVEPTEADAQQMQDAIAEAGYTPVRAEAAQVDPASQGGSCCGHCR